MLSMIGMSRDILGLDFASAGWCLPGNGGSFSVGSELCDRKLRNIAVLFSAVACRGMIGMGRGVGLGERSQRAA